MPIMWDSTAEAKLFAAVIATCEIKFDYKKLAVIMGPECTAKAVAHRISRLRETAKSFDVSATATQTPVKRVRTPKAKAVKSNDDNDGNESPTKKQKSANSEKTVKKNKPEPEVEEDAGEEYPV